MGQDWSDEVIIVTKLDDLPPKNPGLPNKRYDYYKDGKLIKTRWTDGNGQPIKDTHHTDHGNSKEHANVPHDHYWNDGKLGTEVKGE